MTVALAIVAAVAAVAVVALLLAGWTARSRSRSLGRVHGRLHDAESRLADAAGQLDRVEQEGRAAEARAAAADGRSRVAEQKAVDAERRAGDAERRVGEVMRQAEEARRASVPGGVAGAVWELEHLRVEREWMDVVGPGVPLPEPWDGTLGAVVATELSVIREVMGTPSRLALTGEPRSSEPAAAAVTARLSVELLRTLARSGEEMDVKVSPAEITVAQHRVAGEAPPDLSAIAGVAESAGLELTIDMSDEGSEVRLLLMSLPS